MDAEKKLLAADGESGVEIEKMCRPIVKLVATEEMLRSQISQLKAANDQLINHRMSSKAEYQLRPLKAENARLKSDKDGLLAQLKLNCTARRL